MRKYRLALVAASIAAMLALAAAPPADAQTALGVGCTGVEAGDVVPDGSGCAPYVSVSGAINEDTAAFAGIDGTFGKTGVDVGLSEVGWLRPSIRLGAAYAYPTSELSVMIGGGVAVGGRVGVSAAVDYHPQVEMSTTTYSAGVYLDLIE